MMTKDRPQADEEVAAARRAEGIPLERVPALVNACHRRMGQPLSAEDLEEAIQEASVTAWTRRDQFRGDSEPETWIYGIARYSILQQLARRRRHSRETSLDTQEEQPVDTATKPGSRIETALSLSIQEGLQDAGSTVAKIYRGHGIDGRTFVELSEELEMSESAVKARFYRKLPELRRRLRSAWLDLRARKG